MIALRSALAALALVTVIGTAGCSNHPQTMGSPLRTSKMQTVANLPALGDRATVLVRGVMTQKCPVAGCWFDLKDRTGTVRVSTRAAGFVVLDIPTGKTVTVTGRIHRDGEQVQIDARGLQF